MQSTDRARQIVQMREAHREQLNIFGPNALTLLEYLYQNPITTVNRIKKDLKMTYSTTNRLVSNLEEKGILRNATGTSRNRIYTYQSYLDLFDTF